MMQACFGSEPGAPERGRMTVCKAMCDLLWGLIQLANAAENVSTHADTRFGRCETLMGSAGFFRYLQAAERG